LHDDTFDFTGHDAWQIDRHDAAPPGDLAAAQALWQAELREEYLVEKLAGTPRAKIAARLERRYGRRLQTMQRLSAEEVLGMYLDALARAFDPHSDYLGHPERENFNIEMNMSLFGIGGGLQVRGSYCVITSLVPGGPAANSGLLKLGDRIVAVAQDDREPVDIMSMPSFQVVDMIRGPKGSVVRLTVIPAGASDSTRKTVRLVRDEIKLAGQNIKAAMVDTPQPGGPDLRIAVLDLPLFYRNGEGEAGGASADAARLIRKLKQENVRGLILDLRHNGGGSLEEAIRLTGLFIPSGPVLQTLGPQGNVEVGISPQVSALYTGPLVVLTSRWSASAAEIVAGALQDYGRAVIVGDASTFGKGTEQVVVPLKKFFDQHGLGEVHLTTGKLYRPGGASTQLKGVVPDIILPSETDLPNVGESEYRNALPWDALPPVTFAKLAGLRQVLPGLREKSEARVTADAGFRLLREELAMVAKNAKAKSLSLNESVRRREKTAADKIGTEMMAVVLAKAARLPPAHYVTLAELDAPGLPPPPKPQAPTAAARAGVSTLDDAIELSEAENILVDYIHALGPPGEAAAREPDPSPPSQTSRQ
jgi:carboxyl-terminal processing protease